MTALSAGIAGCSTIPVGASDGGDDGESGNEDPGTGDGGGNAGGDTADDAGNGDEGSESGPGTRPDLRSISFGETKQGYVDGEDPIESDENGRAEPVEFEGEQFDRVRIEMTADGFQPYLHLQAPDDFFVFERQDGFTTQLSMGGTYTIWCSSWSGDATGSYELTLELVESGTDGR